MRQLLSFICACILLIAFGFIVKAAPSIQPDAHPGQCSANVQYTQRYQFLPTAFDANEYLKFITEYEGCDVHISQGHEDGTNRDGMYIWYKLPPLAGR